MPVWKPTATITTDADGVHVIVSWADAEGKVQLDRPSTGGWGFDDSPKGRKTAERLAACINAGKAYKPNPKVKTDTGGKTYLDTDTTEFFHGRHMNTSLKKLGF